jgi:hypothetical protein
MGLLKELRLRLWPPRLQDPVFGPLLYMHIPRDPSRSYWEGEWLFPPTQTRVTITLPGPLEGPIESGRAFCLALPARFEEIIHQVRPVLNHVFLEWLGRPLSPDIWQDVELGGFGVEDPAAVPLAWDVGFETKGEKWLGITVPFVGGEPQHPVIDT